MTWKDALEQLIDMANTNGEVWRIRNVLKDLLEAGPFSRMIPRAIIPDGVDFLALPDIGEKESLIDEVQRLFAEISHDVEEKSGVSLVIGVGLALAYFKADPQFSHATLLSWSKAPVGLTQVIPWQQKRDEFVKVMNILFELDREEVCAEIGRMNIGPGSVYLERSLSCWLVFLSVFPVNCERISANLKYCAGLKSCDSSLRDLIDIAIEVQKI